MTRMRHIPRLLAAWLVLAGCGLVEHQAANAQAGESQVEHRDAVTIPLGSVSIEAYLDPNQRALVLNQYDDRGHAQLKTSLPLVESPQFPSSDIVIVQFEPGFSDDDIEQRLMSFIRRGVIEEVAYVAQTDSGGGQQPFLLGNSATIYPSTGTDETRLRDQAEALGYRLESRGWGSIEAYRMVPMDPLQAPSDTAAAAAHLAELDLVDERKTRLDLIETVHNKMR